MVSHAAVDRYLIRKARLGGEIVIPASKSQTLRAILFGALGHGTSVVHRYLSSTDTHAMVAACRTLGAAIDLYPERIEIRGRGEGGAHHQMRIDARSSGIVLRFCTAVGALTAGAVVVTGDADLQRQRPMRALLEGLSQLGVEATSLRGDGYAPVVVRGPMMAGKATISGEDSQPVSALLVAAAFSKGATELVVRHPGEKPWVAMTLGWFSRLGIAYEHHEFTHYRLSGGAQYGGFAYTVPGDLSSAAFPVAAALVTGSELMVRNVDMEDDQGDKEVIGLFQKMGAEIEIDRQARTLRVWKARGLSGISVDINDCIDGIAVLAVVACFADGRTAIRNARNARHKECDRIRALATELRKMGADISETEDGLDIGPASLKGSTLFSYGDHRMVMALSVAALGAEGETSVAPVGCVARSFPTFLRDFNALGAHIACGT